jgi:pyridoxamine 5'-phosphate oxidase
VAQPPNDLPRGALLRELLRLAAPTELGEPFTDDPVALLRRWLADAESSGAYPDANAMTLATATPDGTPSARIVLCKQIDADPPALVFYTRYNSRKGLELAANPRAAAVFFWPHERRQARVEGHVARTSAEESDQYFGSRPILSRLGAVASPQSRPMGSRQELLRSLAAALGDALRGGGVPRPETWGGFRLFIDSLELWTGRAGRLHDRAVWRRQPAGGWAAERLAP